MNWLPTPIYELMPYIWLIIGLIVINSEIHALGEACGILLSVIGLLIIHMRYNSRKV